MRLTLDSLLPLNEPHDHQLITMQTRMYRHLHQSNQSLIVLKIYGRCCFPGIKTLATFIKKKCLNLKVRGIAVRLEW